MRSQSLNIVYSDLNTDDSQRRFLWEQGQIDYMGVDKFENIQKKLDSVSFLRRKNYILMKICKKLVTFSVADDDHSTTS